VQSYYGSSLAAKRFELTPGEREPQPPEGIVRAWNDKILRRGGGQQQERSSPRAARVGLSALLAPEFSRKTENAGDPFSGGHFQSPAPTVRVRKGEIELLPLL